MLLKYTVNIDGIDYYKACKLYDSLKEVLLSGMSNEMIIAKMDESFNKSKSY